MHGTDIANMTIMKGLWFLRSVCMTDYCCGLIVSENRGAIVTVVVVVAVSLANQKNDLTQKNERWISLEVGLNPSLDIESMELNCGNLGTSGVT